MSVIPSLRINGVGILPANTEVSAGTGTAEAGLGGVLTVSTTSAQTPASTTETDLWTYSLPANTLSADGYGLRLRAILTTAANNNNKTFRLYWDGVELHDSGAVAANAAFITYEAVIVRTGASTQGGWRIYERRVAGDGDGSSAVTARDVVAGTADLTGAVILKITGQNGTAAAGDIVLPAGAVVLEFFRPGS